MKRIILILSVVLAFLFRDVIFDPRLIHFSNDMPYGHMSRIYKANQENLNWFVYLCYSMYLILPFALFAALGSQPPCPIEKNPQNGVTNPLAGMLAAFICLVVVFVGFSSVCWTLGALDQLLHPPI